MMALLLLPDSARQIHALADQAGDSEVSEPLLKEVLALAMKYNDWCTVLHANVASHGPQARRACRAAHRHGAGV